LTTEQAPELFVVVADADMEAFVGPLLRRGMEPNRGCVRPFRWCVRRDPFHDAGVLSNPLRAIPDRGSAKVLVLLDHHGSGAEHEDEVDVEGKIIQAAARGGVPEDSVACVTFAPELEQVLAPVWKQWAEFLAQKRAVAPPDDAELLGHLRKNGYAGDSLADVLARHPKECSSALLKRLNLRAQPGHFRDFAERVSLPALKKGQAEKIASILATWFSPGN
jgi:hypothetical protein